MFAKLLIQLDRHLVGDQHRHIRIYSAGIRKVKSGADIKDALRRLT